jgi:hypothetical protein
LSWQLRKTTSSAWSCPRISPLIRQPSKTTRLSRPPVQSPAEASIASATTSTSASDRSREPVSAVRSSRLRAIRPPAARRSVRSPSTSASSISKLPLSGSATHGVSSSSITSGLAGTNSILELTIR